MKLRARIGLLLVLALLAGACSGGGTEDPRDQLRAALRAMSEDPGASITLSLDTDEASLSAMSGAEGGQALPPEVAAALTRLRVRVSGSFSEDPKAPMELALLDGDAAVAELRFVDEVLYLRADVPALLEAFGQDPAAAEGLRKMLAGSGMVPPGAVEGEWVGITGVSEALEQMSGQPAQGAEATARAKEMRDAIARILGDVTDVERVGSDEAGDQLRVRVPLRELYDAVLAEAPKLGLPAELPPRDEVPDETVVVDIWVRDERLSQASFDLLQLAALDPEASEVPDGVERLALKLELARFDGVVEAPEGATQLDGQQLMGMLFMGLGGMMMGGGGSEMGTEQGFPGMAPEGPEMEPTAMHQGPNPVLVAFWSRPAYAAARARYCEQIADMPPSVRQRHYADICPAFA